MVPLGLLVVTTAAGFVVVGGSVGGIGVFVVVTAGGAFVGAAVGFAVVVGASVGGTVGGTVGFIPVVVPTSGAAVVVFPSAFAATKPKARMHTAAEISVAERPISLLAASLPGLVHKRPTRSWPTFRNFSA